MRPGFVILSHAAPLQVLRLARRLDRSFPGARVAVHHDESQSTLDEGALPPSARMVRPQVATRWGDFSLVDATLAGFRALLADPAPPDWITLLSGADYPLHGAARVAAELAATQADVCAQMVRVEPEFRTDAPDLAGRPVGVGARNMRECIRRYYRQSIRLPLPGSRAVVLRTSMPWLVRPFTPYRGGLTCHAGSQWFSARRSAVEQLLHWHDTNPHLAAYLRPREIPDESYAHTIFASSPGIRVHPDNFRYVDWSEMGRHPRTLDENDIGAMRASGAHFARKFLPDASVLDLLDEQLDAELDAHGGAAAHLAR